MFKCLMIYHNTPLARSLQSPMQILQSRSARSDLPMSNAAGKQLGLDPQQLRSKYKNEHLPSHDLHLGQNDVLGLNKQVVVSSYHYQPVFRTKKLQDNNYRGCYL